MKATELLEKIEQIANLGSYQTDLTTGIWTGSPNFISIFGLPKKDFYSIEEFQALVHPEDFEEVMDYFGNCLANQKDFEYEYRCKKPNGEIIYVQSRSKVYYAPDKTPLKIVGIKQDITNHKLYELKLEELNQLNRKKNEVLSLVAHDLKTPISHIESVTNLLETELNHKQLDMIKIQKQACESSKNIISELIEIANLENENKQLPLRKVNINKLIEHSIEHFQFKARDKNIDIITDFNKDAFALINPTKFARVIDNLISNAIKFTPPNKAIQIVTKSEKSKLILKIIDNGIGIPESIIHLIFDKFSKYARRTGTLGERSTGLGLYIVKQIIELHHASIEVKSKVNQGTTFKIILNKET